MISATSRRRRLQVARERSGSARSLDVQLTRMLVGEEFSSVSELASSVGRELYAVSEALARLRRAGLIVMERRGTRMSVRSSIFSREKLQRLQSLISESYGEVGMVYLFGSHARGEAGPLSDIDLGILYRERLRPTLQRELSLMSDVSLIFGDRAKVTILNGAPPTLLYRVISEGIILYASDRDGRVRLETKALSEYLDFRPLLEGCMEAFLAT